MKDKFDELAKGVAQPLTRRVALKKFGLGLAAVAFARFGLANKGAYGGCFQKCMKSCVANLVAQGETKDQATTICHGDCNLACYSFPL